MFGNEVNGVQQSVIDLSDYCIEIPQIGTKHSLNISVSIGIVLWDLYNRNYSIILKSTLLLISDKLILLGNSFKTFSIERGFLLHY